MLEDTRESVEVTCCGMTEPVGARRRVDGDAENDMSLSPRAQADGPGRVWPSSVRPMGNCYYEAYCYNAVDG